MTVDLKQVMYLRLKINLSRINKFENDYLAHVNMSSFQLDWSQIYLHNDEIMNTQSTQSIAIISVKM